MIISKEIQKDDLIEVLVETCGDTIAKVLSNEGDYLMVNYLSPSEKKYKGAQIFSFEETIERVDFESLVTHHVETDLINIKDNMYVYQEDIDEDSSSEIETDEESDSDSEGSLKDFVVPDDEEIRLKPSDHREVDEAWSSWKPTSVGAKRFKKKIDDMEEYMNNKIDEKFVF
jgi:hypothetical protein